MDSAGRATTDRLSDEYLATARSALLYVSSMLTARREPTDAFDAALAAIDDALSSMNGSPPPPGRDNQSHELDGWVTTAQAAGTLGVSERWARELEPLEKASAADVIAARRRERRRAGA